MPITNSRYLDFSYGHRVCGHENVCAGLHGHNGRVHFVCSGSQDKLGRVIDFKVIKEKLCNWVETYWDHKMLIWRGDPLVYYFAHRETHHIAPVEETEEVKRALGSVTIVPFNPTAENMAAYLLNTIGPQQLAGTGVYLKRVIFEETRKCSATAELG